ncbi:hypothetical protein TWF281_011066 [Arthrobotrys megalospora]
MKFALSAVLITSLAATLSSCLPTEAKAPVSIPVPVTTILQDPPVQTGGPDAVAKRDAADLEKRTLGGFYYCDNTNWGFPCNKLYFQNGECRTFSWYVDMGSVGPDPGTWCILYRGHGCTDQSTGAFTSPGSGDNGYSTARYVGSILCWW